MGNGAGGVPGVTVLGARDAEHFPVDYQDRFRYAFRAELADFLGRCADLSRPTDQAATLPSDRMAVEIGVAARASAVQEQPLAVGEDWPWP